MASATLSPGVPTLHHLNNSQSQRILWLLEELSCPYNVVHHVRDKSHRAPPELATIQPLGKSPILVTADGRAIVESSAIVTYLLRTYDTSGQFASADWIRDESLTSFAAATMGPVVAIELLFDLAVKHTPWPFAFIPRAFWKTVQSTFTKGEFAKNLGWLEGELGDKEWFNGDRLGRADVMLSWPMDLITQRGWIDWAQYPKIKAWRERIESRDAWKRGLEKGNGYDLSSW